MQVTLEHLLEAGLHFGHQTRRWNPKMRPYIYGRRNLIHVIDVRKTVLGLLQARKYLQQVVTGGSLVLFVGTKRQAADQIAELIREVQEQLVAGVPDQKLDWRIDELGLIAADPMMLRLVFQNLVENALKFSRALAMEYLLLARPFTAKELAAMGVINYAVPRDQLDAKTKEIAGRLLKRNAYALAYNKRVLNKQALAQFNLVHDAALGYEFLNFYMQTPQAKALGQGRGEDKL